jgi:hypothetical protein
MGRMLIDFAPHINSIVKSHHNRLRDMSNSQNNNLGLGGQVNLAESIRPIRQQSGSNVQRTLRK